MAHLRHVRDMLDEAVWRHDRTKQSILGYVARTLYSKDHGSNMSILLWGSPGVGKTRLARIGIAQGLGLAFESLSLGGMRDSNMLVGHSFTYVGSRPGKLASAIVRSGQLNTVLFCDEADKTISSDGEMNSDVLSVFVHATDPESARHYDADAYFAPLKLRFDQIVWVFAANNPDKISPILRDRMISIEVEELTDEDRVEILKRHVFPEMRAQAGLKPDDVVCSDASSRYIIKFHEKRAVEKEDGMRGLKRTVSRLLERLLLVKIALKGSPDSSLDRLAELGFPFASIQTLPEAIQNWSKGGALDLDATVVDFLAHDPDERSSRRGGRGSDHMYS